MIWSAARHSYTNPRLSPRISPVFDIETYVGKDPELLNLDVSPVVHYFMFGQYEARDLPLLRPTKSSFPQRFCALYDLASSPGLVLREEDRALANWWFDFTSARIIATEHNEGWNNARKLRNSERLTKLSATGTADEIALDQAYTAGSRVVQQAYFPAGIPRVETFTSNLFVRIALEKDCESASAISTNNFSIITPFYKHLYFFKECASSVALLISITQQANPAIQVEWLIANDDPQIPDDALFSLLPESVKAHTRIIATKGAGISGATNRCIDAVDDGWLLFLDCDDVLMPDALLTLSHYINLHKCRYFSSSIIDIDSASNVIRYRRHDQSALAALQIGMTAGHLKAIHKSVFRDYGLFLSAYDGCQDYEFLLRLIEHERIVLIPEYLYGYRWHSKTESTSKSAEQHRRATAARAAYFLKRRMPQPQHSARCRKLGVVIRTTGDRSTTLPESVMSALSAGASHVVVVVHGDQTASAFVQASINKFIDGRVDVISALNTTKSRGYPINVGADFVFGPRGCDAMMLLDDDDIILPSAFTMMSGASPQDAEVWVGRSLRRHTSGEVDEHYILKPAAFLVLENQYPNNSYIVTKKAYEQVLQQFGEYCPEQMHYFEDWAILLRLFCSRCSFRYFDRFVGEFRLGSDGNILVRDRQFEFERCQVFMKSLVSEAKCLTKIELQDQLLSFPQKLARAISDADLDQFFKAWDLEG